MRGLLPLPRLTVLLAVLVAFPWTAAAAQDGDPAAGRVLLEARRLQSSGDLEAALREYELLVERFPNSSQAAEALLLLAEGRARRGDGEAAQQAAAELTRRFPTSRFTASASLLQARILLTGAPSPQQVEAANTLLKRVPLLFGRDAFPQLEARHEARVRQAELDLALGNLEGAAAAYVSAIEDEPPAPWTSRARLGLGRILLAQGEWPAAADVLQRAVGGNEEPAGPDADAAAAADARRLLSAIHRLAIRPASGLPSWLSARHLAVPGVELKRPIGLAADARDHLLVVDRAGLAVELGAGGVPVLSRSIDDPGRPWWFHEQGYLGAGGEVRRMADTWSGSFSAPRGGKREPLKQIAAGASGAFGQWYLLDSGNDRVQVFVPGGAFLSTLAGGEPVDLARDLAGRIYVLDRKAGEVRRFLANGQSDGLKVRGDWRKPEAVEVDVLGRIYVLDRGGSTIEVFDPSGRKVALVGPRLEGGLELKNPVDLTLDASGRLYLADSRLSAVVVLE